MSVDRQPQNKKGKGTSSHNLNRYLVFFDSGEVQYVPHGSVWQLFLDYDSKEMEKQEVWTDCVDQDMASFLRVYFHFYPKRYLLHDVSINQQLIVKQYNTWSNAWISAVDCNLIKLVFKDAVYGNSSFNWFFRGSDKIQSVYKHLQKALLTKPLPVDS